MALFRRLIRSLDTHTNDALSPIIIGTKRSLLQKLLMEAQSHGSGASQPSPNMNRLRRNLRPRPICSPFWWTKLMMNLCRRA